MSAFRHLKLIVLVLAAAISGCSGGGGGDSGPSVPAIATISPAGTSAGNAAFTLTVLGSGFTQSSTVQWNGVGLTTLFFSGSTLHAQVPALNIVAAGTATVTVKDTAGGLSNSRTFTVTGTTIAFESSGRLLGDDVPNLNNVQNIWVMDASGANRTPLTSLTALNVTSSEPKWSPDGSQIAYASTRPLDGSNNPNAGNHNIWVSTPDGQTQKPLTRLSGGADSIAPRYSPDGTRIAYVSTRALDLSDLSIPTPNIWLMNTDGTNPRHLTAVTALQANAASPISWSPDSTQLVFGSNQKLDGSNNSNNAGNIWIVRADGSGLNPLTKGTASPAMLSFFPSWSPDGTKILYLSNLKLDGTDALNTNLIQNIWVVNPDVTNPNPTPLTQLAGSNSSIFNPTWSPDGTQIAFVSARPLNGSDTGVPFGSAQNVWVMNANGSSPTPVTAFTASPIMVFDLAWSAGGTKLLFSSNAAVGGGDALNTNSVTNIFVIDVGGTNQTALTLYTATNTGANAPAQP